MKQIRDANGISTERQSHPSQQVIHCNSLAGSCSSKYHEPVTPSVLLSNKVRCVFFCASFDPLRRGHDKIMKNPCDIGGAKEWSPGMSRIFQFSY